MKNIDAMQSNDFAMLRASILAIIGGEGAEARVWSVQGFGMMRTYFGSGDRFRLNVWDPSLTVAGVSLIHDHPWDFRSRTIAGLLANTLCFAEKPHDCALPAIAQGAEGLYDWKEIKTGPGGGMAPDADGGQLYLYPQRTNFYGPGQGYMQEARDVHMTSYRAGTVTLNDRTNRNGENARVFWQSGTDWVDAKPRRATPNEVRSTLALALRQFD